MKTYAERLASSTCVFCGSPLLVCSNKCDYCGCDYKLSNENKNKYAINKDFLVTEISIVHINGNERFFSPSSTRLNISYIGENKDFDIDIHSKANFKKFNFSLNYKDASIECVGGFIIRKEKSNNGFHYLNKIEVETDQIIIHR